MNEKIILDKLTERRFSPFMIVTNAGDRYEVRHPEFVQVTPRHLYVFPPAGQGRLAREPSIIGLRNVSAIEPLPEGEAA